MYLSHDDNGMMFKLGSLSFCRNGPPIRYWRACLFFFVPKKNTGFAKLAFMIVMFLGCLNRCARYVCVVCALCV